MTEIPINERLYLPRFFNKPRKDGRLNLFQISIDRENRHTICTQTGATTKEGMTWYNHSTYPQKSRNAGKTNYKPPDQVAEEEYQRTILAKLREGYTEIADIDEVLGDKRRVQVTEDIPCLLDLENEAPGFRPWKPQNNLKESSKLWDRAQQGSALFVRKMDGYGGMLVKEGGVFDMYSLRAQRSSPAGGTLYDRLPMVRHWADETGWVIPNKTMFLVEIVPEQMDMDNSYEYVTSMLKSSVELAHIKQNEEGCLVLYVWDVLIWAGMPVGKTVPYQDRLGTIMDIVQSFECSGLTEGFAHLLHTTTDLDIKSLMQSGLPPAPMVLHEPTLLNIGRNCLNPIDYARDMALELGYEGWVVTDPLETMGDAAWSLTGRADRPQCSAKLKPILQDEFVALWGPEHGVGEYGKGKNKNRIGAVNLFQWHGEDFRFVGQCGSGFKDAERDEFMQLLREKPRVFEVMFQGWTQGANLRFPSFIRLREDKGIEDCLYSGPGSPSF